MFPSPQDALPLPPRPSLERYKKIAKELTGACRSADRGAIARWTRSYIDSLVERAELTIPPGMPVEVQGWIDGLSAFAHRTLSGGCRLTAAQFVLARAHGFASWPAFTAHLDELARAGSRDARFEAAADAIVSGEIGRLRELLREEPRLVSARSSRKHRATLLHYAAANGVEGYRQRTPPNIVEIAELLLDAGAPVDATMPVYGGECTTFGLAATSLHPERAGVLEALLATLLARGATLEPPGGAPSIVDDCLANARPRAAAYLSGRGARVGFAAAAGLGRLDLLRSAVRAGPRLPVPPTEVARALFLASEFGHVDVVAFLLVHGADLRARDDNGQTALHRAVIGGHREIVRLLVEAGAPLDVANAYGGTPAGQAEWCARNGGDAGTYREILAILEPGTHARP